ncbi:hypothetical protein ACJX0J_034629 [Zea mays]
MQSTDMYTIQIAIFFMLYSCRGVQLYNIINLLRDMIGNLFEFIRRDYTLLATLAAYHITCGTPLDPLADWILLIASGYFINYKIEKGVELYIPLRFWFLLQSI